VKYDVGKMETTKSKTGTHIGVMTDIKTSIPIIVPQVERSVQVKLITDLPIIDQFPFPMYTHRDFQP
jgi:hypothetical protein